MAKDLRIYHPDGTNEVIESLAKSTHVESANQQIDGQNSDVVNLQIRSAVPVDYQIGSYIDVYGRRYWLNKKGTIRKSSESDFLCTFKMEGVQNQLARSSYDPNLDPTHTGANLRVESLTADLKRFMEVLIMSSQEATPGLFTLGTILQNTETKTISFADSDSCLSVLQRLCQEYDTFFTFTPSSDGSSYAINIGQEGVEFPFTFKYGVGRGIYDLTRDNVDDGNIINRLKVRGSTQNIISSKYGDTCLLLPNTQRSSSYVEDQASIARYGMWVGTKVFDDVYPHRTGTITALGSDVFTFIDSGMDFDLMATDKDGNSLYLLNGESAKIHFNSGQLAGMEFDVISYEHSTKKFVIKAVDDETGFRIPNASTAAYQMKTGDKYVLLNIYLPQSYITTAENELAEKAKKYLKQESTPEVKYSLTLSEFFLKNVMNENPDQNLFWIGDLIKIEDQDMAINASIKIVGLTRDLLDPYNYGLTIADQMVTATVGTTIINDLKDINTTIITNKLFDAARSRRNWRDQQQLLSMIFDPDGYFTDKIRPESVETEMLSVGAKSMQFGLVGTVFQPNYGGKPNRIVVNPGGQLVHYTIDENQARTWNLQNLDQTLTEVGDGKTLATTAYYIYAKCQKSSNIGQIVITTQQHKVNDSTAYWFWIGVLNMVDSDTNTRTIALTYGFTTVNGRFIKTGRIQSADGVTYFDLDAGEIGGKIVFTRNDQQMTVDDLAAESIESKNFINNTLPGLLESMNNQIDGKIETWYTDSDPSTAWTTQEQRAKHVGDLWFNTSTNEAKRYNSSFTWELIRDKDAIQALSDAANAQDTADGKRRVFVSTPYPPYDIGDLWVQGASGDLMRCGTSRQTGAFVSSDWVKATKYTGDENLNDFIQNTYDVAIADIYNQLDGVIETHFGNGVPTLNNAPAVDWNTTSLREKHLGDMYYDNDSGIGYRFSKENGTYKWVEVRDTGVAVALAAAAKAQDTADGKRRVFTAQPYPPYDVGDLWASGIFLKRCITARTSGKYNAADWGNATNYTGDENLNAFIDGVFDETVSDIYNQLDGKLESWYSTSDPANDWSTTDEKNAHVGDQWYNTSSHRLYRYVCRNLRNADFYWKEITNQDAIDAANAAAKAQDTADGKRRVFVSQPVPPYDIGDLWAQGASGDLMRCKTARATGAYSSSDWEKASKYTDNSALNTFVNGAYADQVELFASQIDGKIESWFQSEDPSSNWTTDTEKATHVGDTWFDVSSNALKFYRNMYVSDLRSLYNDHKIRLFKTRSFPTIDGKTASVDDILLIKSSNTLYRAVSETSGTSVKVYWKKVEDQNIVSVAIEFFKLVTNGCCFTYGKPSTPYAIADIYADGNTIFVCQTTRSSGSFVKSDWVEIGEEVFRCWQQTSDQTAIDAYNAAAQAQDTADGKRRIFVKTPYPPYDQGDLWTDGTNLRRCITSRQTGSYVQADWGLATNYDNTQTVIDGGIVTAGTVQLAGDSGSILAGITGEGTTAGSVRFWAGATKENRSVAPFRVLQDGSCYATKLFISGESTFEGKMKAVLGSFKNLRCVNNNGDEVGGITFGSDGKMWFEGDLYHQGYDYTKGRSYRFYASDIICRGQFGARERITMVVYGSNDGSYARIYYNGLENPSYYETINLTSGKATNGTTYYTIPCYGDGTESAGMPIDMVLLRTTSNYRYVLSMADSQRVMVANINDQVWNNLWCNGSEVTWQGGQMAEVIKVGSLMTPNATSSWLGAFQMVGAFSDNNWS